MKISLRGEKTFFIFLPVITTTEVAADDFTRTAGEMADAEIS